MSDFHYGGQAVLEGVMMRGQRNWAIAVRDPAGQIVTHSEPLNSRLYASRWSRTPLLRGLVMLWDTLSLGYRALMFSATVALKEEGVEFSGRMMWGSLAISLLFTVAVFFVVPLLLVGLVDRYIASPLLSTLLEGLIRLGLFLGYIAAISFLPEIRRVFAYHGAEHKTVNAYEAGVALQPVEVKRFSTAHMRCGTSFLLVVLLAFIFITALMGRPTFLVRLSSRILLIPLVASLAYEWLKFGANHYRNTLVRLIAAPGLAVQRLSTREPSEEMLEVAITALREVLRADETALTTTG